MTESHSIALLVTCLVDQLMPEVGIATVKLLRRAGYQVDFPQEQTCCGQPFFNSGFREQAANLARRTIEIFEDHEQVVLPSGSCTAMIRLEYPHLFQNDLNWGPRARQLAAKTYELSEFLTDQAKWQPAQRKGPAQIQGEAGKTATYHDSCHMCRLLGLRKEPRQLLSNIDISLREMSESDRCCGFGGIFSLRVPEVSTAMTAEKLRQAGDSGADTVITADPGCLMQMRSLVGEDGPTIRHLAVVLEESTR